MEFLPIETKRSRRPLTGVRALIALVACCGMILWAARVVWENRDPAVIEERAFQTRALLMLNSGKAAERLTAIRQLERIRLADSSVALRPLTATLGDGDENVRVAAAEALNTLGASAVRMGTEDSAVRAAVRVLIGLVHDPNPRMRTAAVSTLGSFAFAQPMSGLGLRAGPPQLAGTKPAPKRPLPAVKGPVDRVQVVAALTGAMKDPEAEVRRAAIVALAAASTGGPPEALAAGLLDASAVNRRATVHSLDRFQSGLDPWVPLLIRVAERDEDRSVRQAAAGFMSVFFEPPRITAAALPALIAGLESPNPNVGAAVTHGLAVFGPEAQAAIPTLLRVFKAHPGAGSANEWRGLTGAVAETLARVAPGSPSAPEVVATFTEAVRSDRGDRQVRAAWALAPFGPAAESALPALLEMARDNAPNTAVEHDEAAAWTLARIAPGTPAAGAAVAALEGLLRSVRAPSRLAAVEAFARFGTDASASLPRLRALREDPDARVRQAVKSALEILGDAGQP